MTTSSSDRVGISSARLPKRRLLLSLAGLCTAIAAGIGGWYVWRSAGVLEPPAPSLFTSEAELIKAVDDGRTAVRNAPRSANAWGHLGMLLLAHAFLPEAETCFTQARRFDPTNGRWAYLRALILFQTKPDQYVAALEEAADLCGAAAAPRLKLGEVLAEHGRLDEAEANFRAVLEYDPGNPRAELGLGRVAHAQGNWQHSVEHLKRSAERAPRVRATHALLAELYQRLGDAAKVKEELQRIDEGSDNLQWPDPFMDPVDRLRTGIQAHIDVANNLLHQGRGQEATVMMAEIVSAHVDSQAAHTGFGRLLQQTGNLIRAEAEFREAARLRPDSLSTQLDLASLLEQMHKHAEAADHYRQALQIRPQHAGAHYHLGLCLGTLGQKSQAVKELEAAIKYQPDNAPAHRDLAEMLLETGKPVEAERHLQDAVRLDSSDEVARRLLAKVREQMGPDTKR
jgi:tetratricopeptide (TPR) repeat protein